MTDNIVTEKHPAPPRPKAEDFSKEIEHSMERAANERIKVVRVFDNCYRCNWWAPDKMPQSFWLASGTIKKSRFVRATNTTEGLHIEDVTRAGSR
jgi:hypothetical protein